MSFFLCMDPGIFGTAGRILFLQPPNRKGGYPMVNSHIWLWKDPSFLMGKSTISTGPCSIAFCMFTRPGKPVVFLWFSYAFCVSSPGRVNLGLLREKHPIRDIPGP